MRKEFKTRNGRLVLDGAGIEPELKVKGPKASPILISLIQKQLIFDYATVYRSTHDSIAPAKDFIISDEDYERMLFEWSHPFYTRLCKELGWEYPEMDEEGELADPQGFGARVNASGKKLR